jgi:hypothetical protein
MGRVKRGVGDVDRQGGGQHLGVELHALQDEVLLEQGGDERVALAGQVVTLGRSPPL